MALVRQKVWRIARERSNAAQRHLPRSLISAIPGVLLIGTDREWRKVVEPFRCAISELTFSIRGTSDQIALKDRCVPFRWWAVVRRESGDDDDTGVTIAIRSVAYAAHRHPVCRDLIAGAGLPVSALLGPEVPVSRNYLVQLLV